MFGSKSKFPAEGPWNGLDGLSPQSQYQREVDGNPPPTGQDVSQIIDEVIAAQEGVLSVHELACKVDSKVDQVQIDLEKQIAQVEKMPGPAGADGKDGESIVGPAGADGKDGESIVGPAGADGQDGKTPEIKIIGDQIEIDGILTPHLTGKPGKSVPQKRVAGMGSGWAGGGGIQGLKGDPGKDGTGGVTPFSAEVEGSAISIGMALYIKPTTKVSLAQANLGSTLADGIAYSAADSGHACQFITDGQITLTDWTAIVGTTLLTPGARYFLSPDTAGMLTTACPDTTGLNVQCLGKAMSTEILSVEIQSPILL
jgi:hypothetical protein